MQSDNLKHLLSQNLIRPLDYYFACFVSQKKQNDIVALMAAIVSHKNGQGDVCINLRDFAEKELLLNGVASGIHVAAFDKLVQALQNHPRVKTAAFPSPLILDGKRLYLGKYWQYEQMLANNIQQRLEQRVEFDEAVLKKGLQQLFKLQEKEINWQAIAASICVQKCFTVISGGPGTGKTTTVIKVLALLLQQQSDLNIALLAPTGKAAARLSESIKNALSCLPEELARFIPTEAATIHRMLAWQPHKNRFYYNQGNLLPVDVVIIDEASMVDLSLMIQLLQAIPIQARVILLGDRDQLASVEPGRVLGDITGHGQPISYSAKMLKQFDKLGLLADKKMLNQQNDSRAIMDSIALLRKSYRFDENSSIALIAKWIRQSQGEKALSLLQSDAHGDAAFFSMEKERCFSQIVDYAVEKYQLYLQQKNIANALAQFDDFRVLCALHTGEYGVQAMNQQIEQALRAKAVIQQGDYYHGKPIMISRNDYETGLFNGDIGLLWRDQQGKLKAWFKTMQGLRAIDPARLPEHACAFAMTIHKSQGSEFNEVLLLLPEQNMPLYSQELLYTGVTRAKEKIALVALAQSFKLACRQKQKRESGLAELLGW